MRSNFSHLEPPDVQKLLEELWQISHTAGSATA